MSELEKQLVLEAYAFGKESDLIASYILNGPTETRNKLGVSNEQWTVIFDHLVLNHALVYRSVVANTDFFTNEYVKHGITHVREVLGILDDKYDVIWEAAFDYIAIAGDFLYFHVIEHRDRYAAAFRAHGGDFVRKIMGINNPKYKENWGKVLDLLLQTVCNDMFTSQTFDHALQAFSLMMNGMRKHRPLNDEGLITDFELRNL